MSGSGRPMQSVMSSDEHAAKPFLEQIAHQNKIAKLLFVREPRRSLQGSAFPGGSLGTRHGAWERGALCVIGAGNLSKMAMAFRGSPVPIR